MSAAKRPVIVLDDEEEEETIDPALTKRARHEPKEEEPPAPAASLLSNMIQARLLAAAQSMSMARRAPSPLFLDHSLLAAARRRFRENVNRLHASPRDPTVIFDDSIIVVDETTDPVKTVQLHVYRVQEKPPNGEWTIYPSMTGCVERVCTPKNQEQIDRNVAAAKARPDYVDHYQGRASAAQFGSERHAVYEKILLGETTTPAEEELIPPGFLLFLDDHPHLKPYRTEWRVYHQPARIAGSCDALFEDGLLVDWKNCKFGSWGSQTALRELKELGLLLEYKAVGLEAAATPVFPERRMVHVPTKRMPHPFTSKWPDCKLVPYLLQGNGYRGLIEWFAPEYASKHGPIRDIWVVNFPPDKPRVYEILRLAVLPNMAEFFAMFPWNEHDIRHMAHEPEREFWVPRIPFGDPLGMGPTTVRSVRRDTVLRPGLDHWTGDEYRKEPYNLDPSPFQPPPEAKTYKDATEEQKKVAVRRYESWLLQNPHKLKLLVPNLYGKQLYCWCWGDRQAPTCHAHVLARYTNALGQGRIHIREATVEDAGPQQRQLDEFFKKRK
jgi:hypothetical protein